MVVKLTMLIGSATDGAHDAPTMTINNDYSQSTSHVPIGIESTSAQNTTKAMVLIIVLFM
jgi:hypothetical protein